MTDVFLERTFPEPITVQAMQALAGSDNGCLRMHRVEWIASMLSSDGFDMFCHFHAPDAESVRIAMQQAGAMPGRCWSCSILDAPGVAPADMKGANVVVRHLFDEPAGFGARQVQADIDMGCFHLHRVRLLRSYLSADRLRMVSLYQAPDAESVRLAQREAGLPPDRVWSARQFSA